jgi:putative (di)nucleoside polyphosphate hydrolase
MSTVDENGFRPNVGIIIANRGGNVLWARRVGMNDAWQFPQGGINLDETPEQALYRELNEEVGLDAHDVRILGCTRDWLHYRLPSRLLRHHSQPLCVGQKQKWFLLELLADEKKINLQHSTPFEFDRWQWVSFWYPLHHVVNFKKEVYRRALKELAPKLINIEAM